MKLQVTHTFPCTLDVFWQMFWDEDYAEMLSAAANVQRELLWDRTEGATRRWRMKFIPNQELPTMVAKAVGTKRLIYEQESLIDAEKVLHWEVFPAVVPDKVTARGTMVAREVPRGVERIVDGEITVRIPLIGGRIERAIHDSVLQSYERGYEASLKWLDQRELRLT